MIGKLYFSGRFQYEGGVLTLSLDEVNEILNEIAGDIPDVFFERLNGGIVLSPDYKTHPSDKDKKLYILGEYYNDLAMGRYIVLYYGSFSKVHGLDPPDILRARLRQTLLHDFTHHIESLAGEYGLEIKDAKAIAEYLRSAGK